MTMQDAVPAQGADAHQTPAPEPTPVRPRTLTQEEAQRRLEETRQRVQQVIARMQARHQSRTRTPEVAPEALQHRPGEPEHRQHPDQQMTPTRGRGMER
jgi:hypothetical protein